MTNYLTDAELERLAKLSEECGEVVQIIGKIIRHGYDSFHPNEPLVSNRFLLEKELKDVIKSLNLMFDSNDIFSSRVMTGGKPDMKYFHHQGK